MQVAAYTCEFWHTQIVSEGVPIFVLHHQSEEAGPWENA